jgi:anti-sigma-K factor RskA
MMNHQEAYELIEPYVFGTLDPDEAQAVETHLDGGCEACAQRLREVGELSARLAGAVPQADPAPRVKARILERVRAETGSAVQMAPSDRRRMPVFGWVSALAGATAVVVVLIWTISLRQEVTALRHELTASQGQIVRMENRLSTYADAAALLGKPCTRLVSLAGVDPNPQAFGQVLIHPDESFGVIYVYRMPQPPEGMEYQLWMMVDGTPTSVGVFTVLADGTAILKMDAIPDPTSIEEFAVTVEPSGGQAQPTGMMYLTGPNPLGSSTH